MTQSEDPWSIYGLCSVQHGAGGGWTLPHSHPNAPRSYVLELPWQTPPLSLNQRLHWRVKANVTSAVRDTVTFLLRQAKVPALRTPVHVELRYTPRDDRRRDRDNLVATFKPCLDALVAHGVIPDDTADYLDATFPVITAKGPGHATGRFWLTIEEAAL